MKMILAVIQPTRLGALTEALAGVGVTRYTICDAQEFAKREDKTPIYRGMETQSDVLRKVSLEIAVNDDFLGVTVETIMAVARTGHHGSDGDGKIFVLPLDEVVHFHPESRGKGAV
jgi:nitrogen regulatory protein P-II 1